MKYTWDEFHKDAEFLAKKVAGNKFEALLIITKGGMFFGSYLASRLDISYIETIGIKSYKGQERQALKVIKEADWVKLPARLLIVDDIVDSGETLRFVVDRFKAPSVALFKKPGAIFQPTFCLHETNEWVVFPWEENA